MRSEFGIQVGDEPSSVSNFLQNTFQQHGIIFTLWQVQVDNPRPDQRFITAEGFPAITTDVINSLVSLNPNGEERKPQFMGITSYDPTRVKGVAVEYGEMYAIKQPYPNITEEGWTVLWSCPEMLVAYQK